MWTTPSWWSKCSLVEIKSSTILQTLYRKHFFIRQFCCFKVSSQVPRKMTWLKSISIEKGYQESWDYVWLTKDSMSWSAFRVCSRFLIAHVRQSEQLFQCCGVSDCIKECILNDLRRFWFVCPTYTLPEHSHHVFDDVNKVNSSQDIFLIATLKEARSSTINTMLILNSKCGFSFTRYICWNNNNYGTWIVSYGGARLFILMPRR